MSAQHPRRLDTIIGTIALRKYFPIALRVKQLPPVDMINIAALARAWYCDVL